MIKNVVLIFVLALSYSANACGLLTGLFTAEDVSIDYVGSVELGVPSERKGVVTIPLTFSGGKWLENSGVAFEKVNSSVAGNNINFTVKTCLASGGSQNEEVQISINNLASGEYTVNYINPNGSVVYIGKIKI